MSDLVSMGEFADFLGETPDASAGPLLEEVEARFESESRRLNRPYQDQQTGRIEDHDGNGGTELWLDYPILLLTVCQIGLDPASLALDIDTADAAVTVETSGTRKTVLLNGTRTLVYTIGQRRVKRVDGGKFPCGTQVQVTYDTEADLPVGVALAVKREAARLYRLRGTEDETSTRSGGYSGDLALTSGEDWKTAVNLERDVLV